MIDIKFKKCCDDCPYRDIYVNETELVGDRQVIMKCSTIGCNHELVCKEYRESEY